MICNSTPLIHLAKINQLDLIRKLFNTIIIPKNVEEEILIEGKPGYELLKEAISKGWIKIINPKDNKYLGVQKGENQALNLAKEKKDIVILDDAFAISIAKSLNVKYIRTTNIFFLAIEKKLMDKKQALTLIEKLIDSGYYLSPSIYKEMLNMLQ